MDSSKDQGAGKSQNAGTGTGVCIEVQRSKSGKDPKDEVRKDLDSKDRGTGKPKDRGTRENLKMGQRS